MKEKVFTLVVVFAIFWLIFSIMPFLNAWVNSIITWVLGWGAIGTTLLASALVMSVVSMSVKLNK